MLDAVAARQTAARAARAAWDDGLFGGADSDTAARLDRSRRAAATSHLAIRLRLGGMARRLGAPPACFRVPSPDETLVRLAPLLDDPGRAQAVAIDPGTLERSAWFDGPGVRQCWLRAASPAAGLAGRAGSERFYARVVESTRNPPQATLILGNGLGLEPELLPAGRDAAVRLAEAGWRVVEPVSPYHGLRTLPGTYGGEPFVAWGPEATLDLISGQALESALVIAWCRAAFGGPVALAGISMTSFVAQHAASHAGRWSAAARPDGVLLISHSAAMAQVALDGALSRGLGVDRALVAAGWDRPTRARIAAAIDPMPAPAIAAERIVSVLGDTDRWLPVEGGAALADRWRLPAANRFRYPLGHLGMPIQLLRDPAPLRQLRSVVSSG